MSVRNFLVRLSVHWNTVSDITKSTFLSAEIFSILTLFYKKKHFRSPLALPIKEKP